MRSRTDVRVKQLRDLPADEMRFRFLGGRPSLDLSATVGERWNRNFERLLTPSDLDRWITAAGLDVGPTTATPDDLAVARRLRAAIYRVAQCRIDDVAPARADERRLSGTATVPPPAPVLTGGRVTWVAEQPAAAALSLVARDAIDLVSGPLQGRIRECASPSCALLFVDASRPGRRRWCSSGACGGAARAAAYRDRRSALPADK